MLATLTACGDKNGGKSSDLAEDLEEYKLYLDLKSESNLLFSKYDVIVYLDGKEIASVANGTTFGEMYDVFEGNHELVFCKAGDDTVNASHTIAVSGDMTIKCDIGHGSDSIELKNYVATAGVDAVSTTMINVVGMNLSEAKRALEEKGLSNVREEPYERIFNSNNWVVLKQSIDEGTIVNKREEIRLDCIKISEKVANEYTNKNIDEIQTAANIEGYMVSWVDSERNSMNEQVSKFNQDEKKDWIAEKASLSGSTITIVLKYIGDPQKTTKKTTVATTKKTTVATTKKMTVATTKKTTAPPRKTTQKTSSTVFYSTNDRETARQGKTGVYAYSRRVGDNELFYIIDFNKKCVYSFSREEDLCTKANMDSGDLNSLIVVTYHDENLVWKEGLCFKWVRQPETLLVQIESSWDSYEFIYTDLEDALKIRDKKKIVQY